MKPGIEAQTDLHDKAAKHLDDTTARAFEDIRARGFEPFLIYGYSSAATIYSSLPGPVEGQSFVWEEMGLDYTAVLVANDPKHTFEGLRFTSIPKEVAALVPTHNGAVPIRSIFVHDYDGDSIYSEGYGCRDWKQSA